MPYAQDYIGIYKIRNKVTDKCYVGQSLRVKKRIHEHFRLLELGCHVNRILQNSYNKYGKDAFDWSLEVECADPKDLDDLENEFLQGRASFDEPSYFNIANEAKVPMRGKRHSEETKKKIAKSKLGHREHVTEAYVKQQQESRRKKWLFDPAYIANLKFVLDNSDMSYAERGRVIGRETSTVRRMALKYAYLKGVL